MNIICVDDEKGALKLISDSVRKVLPNESVYEFLNAVEAINFAETCVPDIAFLDVQMPEITGLEMAKLLKRINPHINIIFATGYDEYTLDAISLRVSGYLMKPVSVKDIKRELLNLRNPIEGMNKKRIEVKTFGRFEIFVNGKPVEFSRKPAKEALAYLVNLEGATASTKDLFAVLFEDLPYTSSMRSYLSAIIKSMIVALKNVDAENIVIKNANGYAVDKKAFYCDSYEYLKGNPEEINKFYGEYMTQYSWAEEYVMKFYGKR